MLTFEQLLVYKNVHVTGCFAASLSLSHSVWHVHLYIFMFSPVYLTRHVSIVVIFLKKTDEKSRGDQHGRGLGHVMEIGLNHKQMMP